MLRKRLFCTACIFLCVLFSSRAQNADSLAVGYERIVFEGAGLAETNAALRAKADCYKQARRYREASETLARLRLFAMTDEERADVLYQRELCWFLDGDFAQAASMVEEVGDSTEDALLLHALVLAYAGRYAESEIYAARYISWNGPSPRLQELLALYAAAPQPRNQATAAVLSFFPPLGHFYNGRTGEGLLSGALNIASLGFTVANMVSGYWVTAILGGGIALDQTFMGNRERNVALVALHDRNDPIAFGDKVRGFLLYYRTSTQ